MATAQSAEVTAGGALKFLMVVSKLKHLKRTGWVKRGVGEPETVAGHMYRMAIMSFLSDNRTGVDRDRVLKMSLVHDMAEALAGDITPHCGVSEGEKYALEKASLLEMVSHIDKDVGEEIYSLWQEYEECKTAEARLVKDFDKFDMILQAYEYEQSQLGKGGLQEFFDSTKGKFQSDLVKSWVEALQILREGASHEEELVVVDKK